MKHLEVVAAILEYKGKILCMERGKGKYDYVSFKYEFPGGKIEPGEAKHTAIERELREEMDIHVAVKEEDLYMTVNHTYPDFSITMHAFMCHLDTPDFIRKEHIDAKWLAPEDLPTLEWASADVPIMERLAKK
jgi:8-oxo-dGTP diphosphatase